MHPTPREKSLTKSSELHGRLHVDTNHICSDMTLFYSDNWAGIIISKLLLKIISAKYPKCPIFTKIVLLLFLIFGSMKHHSSKYMAFKRQRWNAEYIKYYFELCCRYNCSVNCVFFGCRLYFAEKGTGIRAVDYMGSTDRLVFKKHGSMITGMDLYKVQT